MTSAVAEALRTVAARKPLPRPLAEETFGDLMDGRATEAQKGAILLGIATRGETSEEIAGAVAALRRRMRRVSTRRSPLLDTCGPGGLGRDLFNVSTAAAIVAAGAGAAVAKHGNRSISSRVGSADVLESSQAALLGEALRRREENTVRASTLEEAEEAAQSGFAIIPATLLAADDGEGRLNNGGITVRLLQRPDGSLPGPDDVLAELDAVVARAY